MQIEYIRMNITIIQEDYLLRQISKQQNTLVNML